MFLSCRAIASTLTDDPDEGGVTPLAHAGLRLHLAFCGECCRYVQQVKAVRAALGALEAASVSTETKGRLMGHFRAWHAALAKTSS